MRTWKPDVTVAAIAERSGQFLFVEELSDDSLVINQPAGHVEPDESLLDAVIRETLEETGYHFVPSALIGIYYWHAGRRDRTYLRFAFAGDIRGHEPERRLDDGIVRALWLAPDSVAAEAHRHRSPLVARCVDDYRAGKRYSLDLLTHLI
jgi:8-oxo-dGTP pyrophosphatase MutT (NUDIX family)